MEIVLDNRANLAIANGDAVVKLAPADVAEMLANPLNLPGARA